jgi:dihydrodipicolinate synthase/N-acetylneuraminate lyase
VARTVGVITPCITFFDDDGAVDYDRTGEHVDWLIDAGVNAILANGTCGEFFSLSIDERKQLAERFAGWIDGRVELFVGVMDTSTERAVDFAKHAESVGADAVMSVSPYYSSPPEREVLQYFRDIAGAVEIPFIVYNNPPASGVDLSVPAIAGLADEGVAGLIKESHGDPARIHDLKLLAPDDVPVVYGEDYGAFEALYGGADGWVAGVSNFMPHESVGLYKLATGNDPVAARAELRRLLPLINIVSLKPMFGRPDERPDFIQLYKAALEERGLRGGPSRRPLLPVPDEDIALLREYLAEADITAVTTA